jgi:GNAT superfamily N-acetyltransferase
MQLPVRVRKTITLLLALAAVASAPWWLPEAMMSWTDYTVHHAAKHLARMKSGNIGTPDDYWYAAADLAYYLTAFVTFVGILGTIVVVLYGAHQVRIATSNMRSTARQQQMRLLFDLDLALLNNPELMALTEGHFALDAATLARAKSSAFAHAFLNGCDTIHDYYKLIDPDEDDRYWLAWSAQLSYYLTHRPELRAIARESIDRGFYTDNFRAELIRLLEDAEKQPDTQRTMPPIVVAKPDPAPSDAPSLRELSDSDADAVALRSFYDSVYVREFPDPNERESLANIETYLRVRKPEGWYGKNNYHIVVAELAGRTAALCVADYLADANVGIIEFLVVVPEARGRGLGRQMLNYIESLLIADAQRAKSTYPRGIVAEMNDPFRAAPLDDNMDPFDRAMLWHGWGFRLLDMPYVQPPLSEAQGPVECLVLIAKPLLPLRRLASRHRARPDPRLPDLCHAARRSRD